MKIRNLFDVTGKPPVVAGSTKGIGRAIGVAWDIQDPDSQTQLIATAVEHLGPVEILVANAAVTFHIGSMLDTSAEVFNATMNAHLTGVMQLSQLVIQGMQAAGGGSIILVSSVGGLQGN